MSVSRHMSLIYWAICLNMFPTVPDEDGWCCWCHLCKYCNLICGVWKCGRTCKGGAVVGRPGTRVDGYSSPRARELFLQVSKHGAVGARGGLVRHYMMCKYCNIWSVNDEISMFMLKNKPCMRCLSYQHLISWIRPRGSETPTPLWFGGH
jgi:hypothetical protein